MTQLINPFQPKREVKRVCIECQREYTAWMFPEEPDGFCSEKCEQARQEWDKSVENFFHSEEILK